jgi:uncharacterized membrane protein YkvA (DUF1232 family)
VSTIEITAIAAVVTLLVYALFVLALIAVGRRDTATAVARFIPDCVVLFRRLLGDRRVSRGRKLLLLGLVAYLAMPLDLVPDFIPVAGQLDDAILVVLALRLVLRAGGPELLAQHWPGPDGAREVIARLAFDRR